MKVLDLFSGIGGFSLGLERAGFETVAFCEIDPYCKKVLRKHWPHVPIFGNISNLVVKDGHDHAGRKNELRWLIDDRHKPYDGGICVRADTIDIVCGGFPCQPWSVAGQQRGAEDDRDLWHEMLRIITTAKPEWVIGENVPGLDDDDGMGLERVLSDLEGEGYETQPFEIPACAVSANHRRNRLWVVGHAKLSTRERQRRDGRQILSNEKPSRSDGASSHVPDTNSASRRGREKQRKGRNGQSALHGAQGAMANATQFGNSCGGDNEHGKQYQEPARESGGNRSYGGGQAHHWAFEPDVGRVAHGVPKRVDRLRALGNAVVPQIPEMIGRAIMEAEEWDR